MIRVKDFELSNESIYATGDFRCQSNDVKWAKMSDYTLAWNDQLASTKFRPYKSRLNVSMTNFSAKILEYGQ